MRGLTIVLGGRDAARLRTALTLAATQAALGAPARLFLEGAAVGLLRAPLDQEDAAGEPTLAQLLDTALELEVRLVLCQSGLALANMDAVLLDARFETGGLTGLLANLGDDRLVLG